MIGDFLDRMTSIASGRTAHRRMPARAATAALSLLLAAGGAASASPGPTDAAPSAGRSCIEGLYAALSPTQRAGQLVWVGLDASAAPSGVDSLVRAYGLGGVVLLGGYHDGMASVQAVTAHLHALAGPDIGLMVSADQEGGYVQQLQGSGFSTMPTAYYQGTSWSHSTLLAQTTRWGAEIRQAGVDIDLAPVADTVAASFMSQNGPIGHYYRNYDTTSDRVAADVVTVVAGLHAGGVATTVKHFPGLGRITNNTDTSGTGITDTQTSATSSYLHPFQAGISAGADVVMVGSAWYPLIDPARQAVFSPKVIGGLLRDTMAYAGVVASDDIGTAVAVQSTPVADRATEFLDAGGDVLLTAAPATVAPMIGAILAESSSSTSFADKVEASVLRVLTLKTARGLTACSGRVTRMSGPDRYATSAAISASSFTSGVDTAYLASGEVYTDALSGAPAAARTGGPVLLTAPDAVPGVILDELRRLRPHRVIILGGPATVTDGVQSSVASTLGVPVDRWSGADRFATSAAISAATYAPGVEVAYVASGRVFTDALSGAPVAGKAGGPVLLVDTDALPAPIATELTRLRPRRIVILGGTATISSGVESRLGSYAESVVRWSGPDRFATSAAISAASYAPGVEVVYVASGRVYTDALSGTPVAGRRGDPILLTDTTRLPDPIRDELVRLQPRHIVVLGGSATVSAGVLTALNGVVAP